MTDILDRDLALATTMMGNPLSEDVRARLRAAVGNPCEATWQDAHGLVLNGSVGMGLTLWQAVLQVDAMFGSVKGPVVRWVDDPQHRNGGYSVPVSGWSRTPAAEVIRQAIGYATH